jgi:hypothetical protein
LLYLTASNLAISSKNPSRLISGGAFIGEFYLSPAPQAEPQAVGASFGLSPAPQAEPQAVGASFGLSPAPQAVPQDEPVSAAFVLQPNKFESAIIQHSFRFFRAFVLSVALLYN